MYGRRRPRNKLPLCSEVGSVLFFEAEKDRLEREAKAIDSRAATDQVTKDILGIYQTADVATINPKSVKVKVQDLWKMRSEAMIAISKGQTGMRRRKKKNGKVKRKFGDIANKLFEIADEKRCSEAARKFLESQRLPERKGSIGGIDRAETRRVLEEEMRILAKEEKKEAKEKKRQKCQEEIKAMLAKTSVLDVSLSGEESRKVTNDDEDEFQPRIGQVELGKEMKKKRELETKLAETADRFLIPSGASAHLINAVKALDGKISGEDKEDVVSPQQI